MTSEDSASAPASQAFVCLAVRTPAGDVAERVAAEAFEAGAAGLEERDESGATRLLLYIPAARAAEVRGAIERLGLAGVELAPAEPVAADDWSEAWKTGLGAVDVSPRLRVRPSFVPAEPRAGRSELVIDPGQAFGTGGHESTRLALEALDALAPLAAHVRVLDVGAGTGVLALAALRLGAGHAVAFDLDPLAARAVRENAEANALAAGVACFTGPIEALAGPPFDLVLANLLRSELLPVLGAVAERLAPGGCAVFSGLLELERAEFANALAEHGLAVRGEHTRTDASGVVWLALVTSR